MAEIGSGLAPARRGRPIHPGERIHVIGVGGTASGSAALLAHHAGAIVTACDAGGPSPYTEPLERAGIPIAWRHDVAHVRDASGHLADRIAVTKALTSVRPDHPELAAARDLGIRLEAPQQLIADAAATQGGRLVGVTGTHGKSTTSGWILHTLVRTGRDPGAFVGALLPAADVGQASTVRFGSGDAFVVEADEYAGNFDPYHPSVAVVVTAEWDHPDVFADTEAVVDAIEHWIRASDTPEPALVANASDPGVDRLLERLHDWHGRLVVSAVVDTDVDPVAEAGRLAGRHGTAGGPATALVGRVVDEGPYGSLLELAGWDGAALGVPIELPGRHYAQDALVTAAACRVLGLSMADVVEGLSSFRGVGRRMELKGDVNGIVVLDDYGHHPTAIAATLAAVRQRYPGRRVWAVYEPLTFHRTAAMLEQFGEVLATADEVRIADIWAVRDPDTTIVSSEDLAASVRRHGLASARASGSVEATADELAVETRPGDVVLVMGGGRSYVTAERLVELLRADGS